MSAGEAIQATVETDRPGAVATGVSPVLIPPAPGDLARPVLCHYCGLLPGNTVDHIVPRSLLPRGERMLGKVTDNSVKACQPCNGRKSSFRVDCCERCLSAWKQWGPADWEIKVTVVSKTWVAKKARDLARQ